MKAIVLAALLLSPPPVLGQANPFDIYVAQQKAASDERIAKTYAVAIAIAGACIGIGIFFGLRQSRRDKKD